jgi:uncharacterized protein
LIPSAPDLSRSITKSIIAIVMACRRFRWTVLVLAAAATVVCAHYAITRFQINTTTSNFISADLPWRQDMIEIDRAFPGRANQIVVVIDGKTSELAESAAQSLTHKLESRPDLFQSVVRPDGGPFLNQNGLLFGPLAEVQRNTQELLKARPFLSLLASDPSLRGVMDAFSLISRGVRAKAITLNDVDQPMVELADALDDVLSGRRTFFLANLVDRKGPRAARIAQVHRAATCGDR